MKSNFSRRNFLYAGGTLIALPFFDSLVPRAWGQTAAPTRLVFMKFPNGVLNNTWRPTVAGTDFTLPDQLSALVPYKSDIIVTTGLNNRHASGDPDGAGDHARSGGCFLTCVRINKSEQDIRAATSIDRVIAERLAMTANPRWLVTAAPGGGGGDSGYGSAYTSNISWISANTPASRLTDTRVVFDTLFPNGGMSTPVSELEKKRRYQKSILDNSLAETTAMMNMMGAGDKAKLDQFLSSIREVEKNIAAAAVNTPMACSPGANPGSTGSDFANFTKTMMDLIVLGLACNRSQIVSYFMDYEGSNRGGINGVSQGHHSVSHHPDSAIYPEQYQKITKWYANQFGYFLGKLKAIRPDSADKTLLDSTMVVFGSNIHDGNSHSHYSLPIILAGRGNGALVPGKVVTTSAPIANLYVSLANKMGANVTAFGDSTGGLNGI